MQGDEELRKDIDAVTAIRYPGQFAAAWKQLMEMGGHRLRIVAEDRTYNCHAHGLGIEQLPEYQRRVTKEGNSALVKGSFVTELIERGELHLVEGKSYEPGNVVVYFKDGKPTHTARVAEKDALLVSKWGGNEVIEHGLWELPTSYGDEYKVFKAPDPQRVWTLVEDWLAKN
ncbi:MAG: hypothetical protein K2X72_31585 [Reyranella sp.]|nr:hypothetical protein [Reyranella sp.]